MQVSIELVTLRHVELRPPRIKNFRGANVYLGDILASSVGVSFPEIQLARHWTETFYTVVAVHLP